MKFNVTDPDSGQTVTLEGDSPPTEQELEQVFSTFSKPKADIFRGPTDFEQGFPAQLEQAGKGFAPEIPSTDLSGLSAFSPEIPQEKPPLTQSEIIRNMGGAFGGGTGITPEVTLPQSVEALTTPFVKIPEATAETVKKARPLMGGAFGGGTGITPQEDFGAAATAALLNNVKGILEFGESPAGVATAGLGAGGSTIQKLMGLGFSADIASKIPAAMDAAANAETPEEKGTAYANLAATLGMAIAPALPAIKSVFEGTKPPTTGEVYATKEGLQQESRVGEYKRASEIGAPTEASSGNRPIGSPTSEALPPQQPQEVKPVSTQVHTEAPGQALAPVSGGQPAPAISEKVVTSGPNLPLSLEGPESLNRSDFYDAFKEKNKQPKFPSARLKAGSAGGFFAPEEKMKGVQTTYRNKMAEWNRSEAEAYAKHFKEKTDAGEIPSRQQLENAATNLVSLGRRSEAESLIKKYGYTQNAEGKFSPPTETGPGIVGMGGATPSELIPGTGQDIYSIAQAGREARAAAGQVAAVKPGEGTTLPDSIEHGRELLGQDATAADKAIAKFESDPEKAVSANGIAVTRAKGEELSLAARRIEEKFGTDSPEYRVAWKALSDWDARTKPMQTEWQKMGVAQQGATDIDTGSITGLQRAYKENTGQDFNPPQIKKAAKIVAGVKKADVIVETAKPVLQTAIDSIPEKVKTPDDIPGQKNTFAGYESGKPMSPEQIKVIWKRAKSYIDQGMDDKPAIIYKVASDLGINSKDVLQGMSKTRQVKRVADDVWQKQRQARILKDLAKRWVYKANETWASKIIPVTARTAFAAKTGLHGTVAMGTHAPLVVATHPKIFAENFGKMYKLVVSPEFYQMQQFELSRRPNYNVAQRAGLVNDMSKMEDFSDPNLSQGFPRLAAFFKEKLDKAHLGRLVGMGTRGYSVLKVLRQDLFDHEWNKLADGDKSPDMAKAISDTVNHITGVVKAGAPTGAHYALFAPKLLLSRLAVVGRDPAIAANSLLKMENMSPSEKWFLKNQVKEKAKIFAVASGLLAANQQLNNFLGDKKKLNGVPESLGGAGFDPMKSDFMKYRVAGMNFAWGSPFLTMMRLPLRIIRIGMGDGGKSKNLIYPDESMAYEAFKYARTQESPFLNPIVSLITKADYAGRPLPQIPGYGPPPPVPKRLAAQGVKPYTWPEFVAETVLPIPFQEGAKEIFHYAASGDDDKEKALLKGFLTTLIMSATGGRVGEDWDKPQTPVRRALVQQ